MLLFTFLFRDADSDAWVQYSDRMNRWNTEHSIPTFHESRGGRSRDTSVRLHDRQQLPEESIDNSVRSTDASTWYSRILDSRLWNAMVGG